MEREKTTMLHKIITLFGVLTAGVLMTAAAGSCADGLQMKVSAETVDISTFYNGTTVEVTGAVADGSDVVIEVSGPKTDVHLKEKGKVLGLLWMNKTDVSLENAPADYMIYFPENVTQELIGEKTGVGYEAVEKEITIEPASEDRAFIFGEYVKLMEKSGVYALNEGGVTYGQANDGMKPFSATLDIPSKMKPGSYHIKALAVNQGAVTEQIEQELNLRLTGFPAMISKLAFGNSLLFGIMAVVIAIAAGLIIGTLFKGGGGAH